MNIFVAGLPFQTQEDQLRQTFENYGEVDSVKIVMDRDSGRSKGFGFVEMPNDEEANSAINSLNDSEYGGRTIVVKQAREREEGGGGRGNRNFGGGGRSSFRNQGRY